MHISPCWCQISGYLTRL